VGVDLEVQEAGIAKTSLYRHFPTKDDLIVEFLEREAVDFWSVWDDPQLLGGQLALLVNGAFVSAGLLKPKEATDVLLASAKVLCKAALPGNT